MIRWSDWLPDMLAQLPGCPTFTVEHELRRAAIRFFEDSRAWKATLDPMPVAAGEAEIELSSDNPGQETIVRLESAYYDGRNMDVLSPAEMDARFPGDWSQTQGDPKAIVQAMSGVIQIYPIPAQRSNEGLKMRVSLRPSESATQLPDSLRKYRRAIVTGAMAALRAYSDQPWSALDVSIMQDGQFQVAIDYASRDSARAFGRGRIASRPTWC